MSAPHFRPPNRLRTGRGVKFFLPQQKKAATGHPKNAESCPLISPVHHSRCLADNKGNGRFVDFTARYFQKTGFTDGKGRRKIKKMQAMPSRQHGMDRRQHGTDRQQHPVPRNKHGQKLRKLPMATQQQSRLVLRHAQRLCPAGIRQIGQSLTAIQAGGICYRPVCGKGDTPFVSPNGYTVGIFVESHSIHG